MLRCSRSRRPSLLSRRGRSTAHLAAASPDRRALRFESLEDRRMLAVFSVDNLNDSGTGSLRQAILDANGAGSVDEITFSVTGTIILASALPTITDDLTITGPGAGNVTIDADGGGDGVLDGDGFLIFWIDDGTAAQLDVSITGLTLTGADNTFAGGAIRNHEDLVLDQLAIVGNRATFGGGIANQATGEVTLTASILSGNIAGQNGGAINNGGILDITNNTFSGNYAYDHGGALVNYGAGVDATLTSNTLTGNTAVFSAAGSVWNASSASLDVNNTIINGFVLNEGGASLTGDFNLFGEANPGITGGSNNQFSTDPQLGPLADNGGPTLTHALLPGSPAVDAGDSSESTDQRGLSRPIDVVGIVNTGDGSDIGALEVQPFTLVVDTTDDDLDGVYTAGELSLREAIGWANSLSGADTITFDASVFTGGAASVIRLQSTQLSISESVTIDAAALGVVITRDSVGDDTLVPGTFITDIDASDAAGTLADNAGRVLDIVALAGDSVQLIGLTITGADLNNRGAGIKSNFPNLAINQSSISGNRATESGGGIYSVSGDVTLTGSTVSGNSSAFYRGGGIYSKSGDVKLSGSTVSSNTSGSTGGGIYSNLGDVTLTNATVSGNISGDNGGGIFSISGDVTITGSTVSGNSSGFHGGGGVSSAGMLDIASSTLSGNSARFGGAIRNSGIATIISSTISGNTAVEAAGGIATNGGTLTVISSTITENSSPDGGGVYFEPGTASVTLSSSIVANNSGQDLTGDDFSGSYNLIGDGLNLGALTDTVTGAPLLGPLADNGGPTQTHALLPGSPALDVLSVAADPVAFYRFEETGGGTVADQTGNHDGTVSGIDLDAAGPLGSSAARFDGVDDYVNVSSTFSGSELSGDSYSVELWFNTPGGKTQDLIALHTPTGAPNPDHAVLIELTATDQLRFLNRLPLGAPGDDSITGSNAFNANTWHHLAVVRNGTFMNTYLDGVNILGWAGASGDLPPGGGLELTIGALDDIQLIRFFEGMIDDVAIYNRALTDDEVAAHAAAGTPAFDQRGESRVADGGGGLLMDIGAYEAQSAPSADFVDDDIITGFDFLAWQRGFGTTSGASRADGDSDNDGDVDASDLAAWQLTYGQVDTTPVVVNGEEGFGVQGSEFVETETTPIEVAVVSSEPSAVSTQPPEGTGSELQAVASGDGARDRGSEFPVSDSESIEQTRADSSVDAATLDAARLWQQKREGLLEQRPDFVEREVVFEQFFGDRQRFDDALSEVGVKKRGQRRAELSDNPEGSDSFSWLDERLLEKVFG